MSLQGHLLTRPVPRDSVLPLLKSMPAHCQELVLLSRTLPANEPEQPAEQGDTIIAERARTSGRPA